jgi:hypothetical protein
MLTLVNVHTTTALSPPRIITLGPPGVGKTSLAAKFPHPIFLQTEDGCPAGLEIATFGVLASYENVIAAITALGHEQHNSQTVVLDSLDALEPLIWNATCVANNWRSIESAGYGRGYVEGRLYHYPIVARRLRLHHLRTYPMAAKLHNHNLHHHNLRHVNPRHNPAAGCRRGVSNRRLPKQV